MRIFLVKHKKYIPSETKDEIITSFKILYARFKAEKKNSHILY